MQCAPNTEIKDKRDEWSHEPVRVVFFVLYVLFPLAVVFLGPICYGDTFTLAKSQEVLTNLFKTAAANPFNIHGPRQDSRELHRFWAAGGGSHCKSSWNDRRAGDRNDDIYIFSKIVVVNTQLSYLTPSRPKPSLAPKP